MHDAIRTIRVGRGYGVTDVPVVDLAAVSKKGSLHVVGREYRPICGARGDVGEILEACDPRAVVVARRPVCVSCQERLGAVPMPELVKGGDASPE